MQAKTRGGAIRKRGSKGGAKKGSKGGAKKSAKVRQVLVVAENPVQKLPTESSDPIEDKEVDGVDEAPVMVHDQRQAVDTKTTSNGGS